MKLYILSGIFIFCLFLSSCVNYKVTEYTSLQKAQNKIAQKSNDELNKRFEYFLNVDGSVYNYKLLNYLPLRTDSIYTGIIQATDYKWVNAKKSMDLTGDTEYTTTVDGWLVKANSSNEAHRLNREQKKFIRQAYFYTENIANCELGDTIILNSEDVALTRLYYPSSGKSAGAVFGIIVGAIGIGGYLFYLWLSSF